MANRYWVGGAGTWNTTSTTNWSTASGGAGGASVPTAADSVFFDQAGTYTVTCTGALTCLDITVSAGTVTFANGTSPTFAISGSMSLLAGTVWSTTGLITFNATTTGKTITTNGTTISAVTFNGLGGAWTLGSALNIGATSLTLTAGTFNTAGYAVTAQTITSSSTSVRGINLSSSTVSLSVANVFGVWSLTNLTWNAGTSTINCTSSGSPNFYFNGLAFYNISFTNTGITGATMQGVGSLNNLSVVGPAAIGVINVGFTANSTFSGGLQTSGTAGNRRVFFASSTYGIGWTLTINGASSLTDADFRDLYIIGTASPISGTRIGNRGNCTGITFDAPKTVYWNLAGAQNWSANGWAASSGGAPSTNNFPLPQDTAVFDNTGSVTGTITLDTAMSYVSSVDMSPRTSAMTLDFTNATTWYGNWKNGSGTTLSGTATQTLSGGSTQTITSAGIAFTCPITVDAYGGTVQLADAFNISTNILTVTNGTFNTAGFAVTADSISSNNSNVRTISLGASAVTLTANTPFSFTTTNLTFNAGTSTIIISSASSSSKSFNGAGVTFYNVSFTGNNSAFINITGANTFNNLTITASSTDGYMPCTFSANQTINGTFTCGGGSAVQRGFVQSSVLGTKITLTVNSLSATDTDFRDVGIAGAASGTAPTRAGDCGNNSGITFPVAKTVYWNLAGSQNWSAIAWCTASGGTPNVNNFPLPQDTAVFNNAGSITSVSIQTIWNIGTFDASARTSAMTLITTTPSPSIYGDWKFGTGVSTTGSTGVLFFSKYGTQTITSNGVQFSCGLGPSNPNTILQLADALSLNSARTLFNTGGTFDAVSYNVTTGAVSNSLSTNTLKMGSGTWTLSGTGTVWNFGTIPIMYSGTATIVLSDTSAATRTFAGGGGYYNKLTIGGTTGTSTLTFAGNNTFGELASTKTVAHTIDFVATTQSFGKWSVTGTLGNVVTVSGSSTSNMIYGPAVTGVDYLNMGTWGISTTSPGEFYAGANSTGTAAAPVFRTAAPTPRTLYWVGGTGNWSSTTKWSTSSGGASGAAIPTSLDSVNFDSASNATAYIATIDAGVTIARCAAFTMAGPASGTVTFAGTVTSALHGNVSFAATGVTSTYSGTMYLVGNLSYTLTTNGINPSVNQILISGIGSTWTLGGALSTSTLGVQFGSFSTSASNYSLSGSISTSSNNLRTINLNASTVTISSVSPISASPTNLTFNAGTSSIVISTTPTVNFFAGGLTFYNVSFSSGSATSIQFTGANTFNNLTFASVTTPGINKVTFPANQTINGTLTLGAGTAASYRTFLASNVLGTTRTLTVNALAAGAADIDFMDITIAGAAAPISGTRFGDCKGNSGITFPAAKTVYFRATGSANWGATSTGSWSATSGGALDATQFPLAQDTAIFPAATYPASGSTTTINANYNIGTIDMSLRTSNTMTLATGTTTPTIYGNWINGTGITISGTGIMTFSGRGSQTITSSGVTFTQPISINTPGGSVTLQDAFVSNTSGSYGISLFGGTINANNYNVTFSGSPTNALQAGSVSVAQTLALGSGTWSISTVWNVTSNTLLTVTGTGVISMIRATAKTFAGGGANYSGITLNQGGAGTLTISGNNTFANITNTYSATGATTISLASTTQTVAAFTATGTSGKLLTITGTSAAAPATLVYTGAGALSGVGYVVPTFVLAYPTTTTWSVNNSTNGGSLGFVFTTSGTVYNASISEAASGIDSVVGYAIFYSAVQELASGIDLVSARFIANSNVSETASGVDSVSSIATFASSISETASGVDDISSAQTFATTISETGSGLDQIDAAQTFTTAVSETGSGIDQVDASQVFITSVSETASGVDSDSVAASTFNAYSEETASGVDNASSTQTFASDVAESGSGVDSTNALQTFITNVSETASGLDQVDSSQTFFTAVSEAGSGIDQVDASAVFSSSASETASGVDSVSSNPLFASSISETASGIDAVSSKQSFASDVAETAAGIDAVSAKQRFKTSVTETASGVDQVDSSQTFLSLISETASGVDSDSVAASTFNAYASETSSGVDSISSSASFGSSVNETGAGIDAISSKQTFATDVSEAGSGVDAASAAQGFATTISETASGVDSVSSNPTFGSSISEAASGVDSIFSNVSFASSIAETASGVDSIYSYQGFAALISEAASGIDVISTAGSIFGAIFTDSASGIDVNQPNFTYFITVPEGVNAQDLIYARYLWELIDNTEAADWVNINDTQTASWSQIDDTQALNWQNVGNTQTATWSQIDNTESGNWEQI